MKILVIGGTSEIALCAAEEFGKNGFQIDLASRNLENQNVLASDLSIRLNSDINTYKLDVSDEANFFALWNSYKELPDVVLISVGLLGDQEKATYDYEFAKKIVNTNFNYLIPIITTISNDFEKQNKGSLIVISSVAGDRGRRSNYVYGSAKAALTAFLSGLRARLSSTNVKILTVKPGIVNTKMIIGSNSPRLLTADPHKVGKDIYKAYVKGKEVIYTPKYWKYIMMVVKLLPEFIFKRTKF